MFDMGRYGIYVWPCYALFVAMLLWDLLVPWLKQRRLLRELALKQRRAAARAASNGNPQ